MLGLSHLILHYACGVAQEITQAPLGSLLLEDIYFNDACQ